MDGGASLFAGAPQGGLHLGHRRLLLHRHHARRRHAHHRHGGDERLPPGAVQQDARAERPCRGAQPHQFQRLRRRRRPDPRRAGRQIRASPGRGAGHDLDAVDVERRAGAGLARGRPQTAQGHRRQYPFRHARRLRQASRARARHPACQRAQRQGRRSGLASDPARRLDRARHRAEGETLSRGRDLRDRHVRI